MTATVPAFRIQFPEFSSTESYPDPMVTSWLTVASRFVNQERWGDSTDFGIYLHAAHNLTIAAKNQQAVEFGGAPGQSAGAMTSKSAAGVSAGYDFASVKEEGAGWWNETSYGRQFYRLSQMMGAGPLQIGTDGGYAPNTGAWPGPTF
jgi:hypothetical protein